jgi:5-formyltetrahydrofolate cyclo-ligase
VRVAYPRVVPGTRVLDFAEGALASGAFGLLEPGGPALALAEIAAFVIPGIAFSRDGGRIGWGRGYYDTTLAAARADALRIGLAFDCQLVADVPREAHDIGVDLVVTETASYGRR